MANAVSVKRIKKMINTIVLGIIGGLVISFFALPAIVLYMFNELTWNKFWRFWQIIWK